MKTAEQIAKIITKGTVEEKLEVLLEGEDTSRPFLIWVHTVNAPTKQNPRSEAEERLFVQHLDACHSNMETVHRYQAEGKRILNAHIPVSTDKDQEGRLSEIRNHVEMRDKERARIREEVMAEMGVTEKLALRTAKDKAKAEAEASKKSEENKPSDQTDNQNTNA